MNSGYHNRNKKQDRRDSPSASTSRPRSSSKSTTASNVANSDNTNQRNRTPPKSVNGKMPSVANTASDTNALSDGMASMTLENIRYPVGSKITAKLITGAVTKGEVVAFDPNFKIAIIKAPGSRAGHSNVSILNLTNCTEIKVDEEGKESPGEMQALNPQKLQERLKTQIERKKKLITAFKAGISPEGQKLFQCINRTLDEVAWQGDKILVMNKVVIEPPYRPETVRIKPGLKEDESALKNLSHIKKIVERYLSEVEASGATARSSNPAMTSPMASADSQPTPAAVSASSRTSGGPPGGVSGGPSHPVHHTTIPNLPQAAAPPSTSSSSHSKPPGGGGGPGNSSRSNRNNPGRKQHHDHHPKPMYN